MNLKEHLQFLIMMIPSLLLLVAAAVTLAFPMKSLGEPATIAQSLPESGETSARDTDIGPVNIALDR